MKEQLEAFLAFIEKHDDYTIFFDSDADGTTAAAMLVKILKNHEKKYALKAAFDREAVPQTNGYLIILDLNPGLKNERAVCVDHHKTSHDTGYALFVHPRKSGIEETGYYPTSGILMQAAELDGIECSFLGAAGIYADCAGLKNLFEIHWKDFFEKLEFDPKILFERIDRPLHFGEEVANREAEILSEFSSWNDIAESDFLKKYAKDYDSEFKRLKDEFEANKKEHGDVVYSFISPKLEGMTGSLSTKISTSKEYFNKTFILISKTSKETCSASFRRQDNKKDMSDLVKKLITGIEGAKGGGHPAASGMIFPKEKLSEIIRRIEEL